MVEDVEIVPDGHLVALDLEAVLMRMQSLAFWDESFQLLAMVRIKT